MQGPIRIIFSITVLVLWALFGIGLATGAWAPQQWLMLVLGHLACSIIFVSFIYVFNYGYGLSLALIGAALAWLMPSTASVLVGALAVAFGLRMIAFTHARYQSASYAANFARQKQASAAMPLPGKLFLWVFVSWLMSFELMALYFVASSGRITGSVLAGAVVMLLGLIVEALADRQKQAAKNRDAAAFVREGLFRWVRHVNYTGEILFQLGLIIAALGSVSGWWQVLVALLAPLYIITLMCVEAAHADRERDKRHGADPAWQAYRARTGRLLPGL